MGFFNNGGFLLLRVFRFEFSVQPLEKKAERKRKNRRENNLRSNLRIKERNKVFVSVEYKTKGKFQSGAKKHRPKAKKHYVHGASPEDINGCKSSKNAENKKHKGVEPKNRFGSAVAEKSEEKTKKPTGEFALINGDADAGGQNKNWFYSVKINKTGSGLDYIC